jgi:predicted DNA-binding transcriptional regulator AlpA
MADTANTNTEALHNPQKLLTAREVAGLLGTTASTLSSWRTMGKTDLKWVKVGTKLVRYQLSEVLNYIERQRQGVGHAETQAA